MSGSETAPADDTRDRDKAPEEINQTDDTAPATVRRALWRLFGGLGDEAKDLAFQVRRHLRLLVLFVVVLLLGAVLFAWSGVYSIAATTGHYPFFRWFLAFGLRQSVETHVIGIEVPQLEPPHRVLRAAGHYQGGCAPCHGAPGETRNPITRRMLPEPPYLPNVIHDWTPAELFWIVKHGIKYAGMPAWVAPRREDEVWDMVAFLRGLPEMDPETYRRLAFGPVADLTEGADEGLRLLLANGPVGQGIAACARCHGFDGASRGAGAIPRLAGLSTEYLYEALKSYALGTRPSGIMQPVASELNEAEMRALAGYYAAQPPPPPAVPAEPPAPDLLHLGRRIALEGLPESRVAACASCHGPKDGPPPPALYPTLNGQHAEYIAIQLHLWMRGVRGSRLDGALSRIMAMGVGMIYVHHDDEWVKQVPSMTDEQIRAVALYYASLPATPAPAGVARRD